MELRGFTAYSKKICNSLGRSIKVPKYQKDNVLDFITQILDTKDTFHFNQLVIILLVSLNACVHLNLVHKTQIIQHIINLMLVVPTELELLQNVRLWQRFEDFFENITL